MKCRFFLLFLVAELSILVVLVLLSSFDARRTNAVSIQKSTLVRVLSLTDLSLWTEARYTRHPSQADLFAPFQNGPGALESFPAGTWGPPPREVWQVQGNATQEEVGP